MSGMVAMRTLYFKPRLAKGLPRDCCVVELCRTAGASKKTLERIFQKEKTAT